jgi:hypothetical protein
MAIVGNNIPGDAQEASEMAAQLLDLDTKVRLIDMDDHKFKNQISSWTKGMVSSKKYNMDMKTIRSLLIL